MFVPEPLILAQLERITPSIYAASTNCLAKAAWFALGDGDVLPQHPAAILGTAFHAVVAAAHKGALPVAGVGDRTPARNLFDMTSRQLHERAHPLVKLKFRSADRLPFYNLHREQSAHMATPVAVSKPQSSGSAIGETNPNGLRARTEFHLCSKDGRIAGRADHIDGRSGAVIDYKTGHVLEDEADAGAMSDSEIRQLRLYAYLAAENGIDIEKGVIARGDGRGCEIEISQAEAETEADHAREQLGKFNAAVGRGAIFPDLATPSSKNCSFCPCIPFCESFWATAQPDWAADCGIHIEGDIAEVESRQIQGVSLTTLVLSRRAGTIAGQSASVEQIPDEWMMIDGLNLPRIGDAVRIVHGRQIGEDMDAAVVRVDKTSTAVWRLGNADGVPRADEK